MAFTEAQVALVSVGVGPRAATIPSVIAWRSQRGQHASVEEKLATGTQEHERALSAAARRQVDLRAVYPKIIRFVVSEMDRMNATESPFPRDAPPRPDDATVLDLQASVYAYASVP